MTGFDWAIGIGWRGFAAAVAAVAIGWAVAAAAEADGDPVARGHHIAVVACAPCHAIGEHDASPRTQAMPFRELGRKYSMEALGEMLSAGVVVGHPDMPEVKMEEIDVVTFLAWLKTIQTK